MTTFREKENRQGVLFDETDKTHIYVEDFQAVEEAINTIEQNLGDTYVGAFTTLSERLTDIEERLSLLE